MEKSSETQVSKEELFAACMNEDMPVLLRYLSHYKDFNNIKSEEGQTPLMAAVLAGKPAAAELIATNCLVNKKFASITHASVCLLILR